MMKEDQGYVSNAPVAIEKDNNRKDISRNSKHTAYNITPIYSHIYIFTYLLPGKVLETYASLRIKLRNSYVISSVYVAPVSVDLVG